MLHWDTSTFDGREKVKIIQSWIFMIFLYEIYTGFNALKQKNVKFGIVFEKCISILNDFVPVVFENVVQQLIVRIYQSESHCVFKCLGLQFTYVAEWFRRGLLKVASGAKKKKKKNTIFKDATKSCLQITA